MKLFVEQLKEPIGLNMQKPRFSWKFDEDVNDLYQISYKILLSTDLEFKNIVWDSGEVLSNQVSLIEYTGNNRLLAFTRYYFNVSIKLSDNKTYESKSHFTMGLTDDTPWTAPFIKMGMMDYHYNRAEYYRKNFVVNKEVDYALIFVVGLGYNEVSINGKKQGDAIMEPGFTTFNKRVQYVSYDITNDINVGVNAVGITLGEGWFNNKNEAFDHFFFVQKILWTQDPKMSCEIVLNYKDGTREIIDNMNGWTVGDGPIVYNDVFNGERYDARLEIPGFDTVEGNKDFRNYKPEEVKSPAEIIEPELNEPIKVIDEIKPISLTEPDQNVYVFDMGRNFAGFVRLKVEAPRGTRILLKFGEMLYDNGMVNQENLRWAQNTDEYVCKGTGVEIWEPRFTYHGFRYVSLEGIKPTLDTLTGLTVRSAVEKIGSFECSNELLNKIQEMVVHTEESNMHSVPTDCPQRDERQGWVNDCTVRIEEIIYNFGVGAFMRKWQKDMADTQEEDGSIKDVAPRVYGADKADPLSSIFLFVPWYNYMFYGDKRIIEEQYSNLCKWENYLTARSYNGIMTYYNYGDWAGPVDGCIGGRENNSGLSDITPGEFVATIFYYQNAEMLAKMAEILGKEQDKQEFLGLASYIKNAINDKFFNYETANYAKGSQASNILALHFGIVPDGYKKQVLDNLVNDIHAHGDHLTTGNIATKYMFEVLSDNGLVDLAMEVATKEDYPSWGYMISKGATTVWERWELGVTSAMNSHNHPMYGTISTWFYKHLCGIRPLKPGFDLVGISPKIPTKLEFANCSLDTVRGKILVNWKKEEGSKKLIFDIALPCGSNALFTIPDNYNLDGKSGNIELKPGKTQLILALN